MDMIKAIYIINVLRLKGMGQGAWSQQLSALCAMRHAKKKLISADQGWSED